MLKVMWDDGFATITGDFAAWNNAANIMEPYDPSLSAGLGDIAVEALHNGGELPQWIGSRRIIDAMVERGAAVESD